MDQTTVTSNVQKISWSLDMQILRYARVDRQTDWHADCNTSLTCRGQSKHYFYQFRLCNTLLLLLLLLPLLFFYLMGLVSHSYSKTSEDDLIGFLQATCPFCCPTNSVKALKGTQCTDTILGKSRARLYPPLSIWHLTDSSMVWYGIVGFNVPLDTL